jgi:DNA-binding MarR family transcriptional regulator
MILIASGPVGTTSGSGARARAAKPRLRDDELRAWRHFLRAHAVVVAAIEADLEAETGLPLVEYDVLVQLAEAPERRLRMQELAERVLFSRSGLTRLVDRMVAAGLVRRERCSDDGRGSYAVLTRAGLDRLRAATGPHLRAVEREFARVLGRRDLAALDTASARLLAAHDEAGDD